LVQQPSGAVKGDRNSGKGGFETRPYKIPAPWKRLNTLTY
jgi:hypothetical protein